MNFEKSFENFVQILSEEAIKPEISPSAIADLAKEYSLRSIVSIVSFIKGSDHEGEPDTIIPLFGPVPEGEPPAYYFQNKMAGQKLVTYNIYLYGDRHWNDEEYKSFSVLIDILSFHMERFLLNTVVRESSLKQYLTGLPNS